MYTIDYATNGQVQFTMFDFIDETVQEAPDEIMTGVSAAPAAHYLFVINENAEKLSKDNAEIFHHLVAKLLYLGHRARPDIQLAVSFLSTRVQSPDLDDFKKLGHYLRYLRDSRNLPLILKASDMTKISWWVILIKFREQKRCDIYIHLIFL